MIFCKFALCTFNLCDRVINFSCLMKSLRWLMCNERNHSTCYTVTIYELHFQEQKKKKTNQHNQSKSKNLRFKNLYSVHPVPILCLLLEIILSPHKWGMKHLCNSKELSFMTEQLLCFKFFNGFLRCASWP